MSSEYFRPFAPKTKPTGVNVLTIAETFPSLIQPWLVNHLVQIIKHGGDNRVLSRRKENVFSDAIIQYGLDKKFLCVEDNRNALLKNLGNLIQKPSGCKTNFLLLADVLKAECPATLKQRIFEQLFAPALAVDPEIMHSHAELPGYRLRNIARVKNIPHVVTFHGLPPVGVHKITPEQRQEYTAEVKKVFVNTEFAKSQYVSIGGPAEKVEIVPQGIDLSNWPLFIKDYPEEGPVNILTVGRYHVDKGHKYALIAVSELIKKGHAIHYTMVGSGPEMEAIKEQAKELNIESSVSVRTMVPDAELRDIYKSSHIFVLPSLRSFDGFHEETQGVVLQEAQASGLITIAAKSGGIPECIDDGVSGFLVPDRDSEALAGMIEKVIARKDEWKDIQRKGRQWVETHYAADVIGQRMNGYYRDIAGLA